MESESRGTRRSRPPTPVLAVLVAALVAIAALFVVRGWVHHGAPPATTAHSGPAPTRTGTARPSVAQTILARHMDSDGVLDVQGVLELFSYAVTPLPGVTVPSGADSTGNWGELALEAMPPHLDELSPAQRDIVLKYYRPAAGTAPISVEMGAAPGRTAAARRPSHLMAAAFFALPPPAPTSPSTAVQVAIASDIQGAITAEGKKLGHSIGDSPTDGKDAVQIIFAAADNPAGPAWIRGTYGPLSSDGTGHSNGALTNCTIFVGPSIWANWGPTKLQVAQMYHEVFHCYQAFVIGHDQVAVMDAMPLWIREGGADWAASSMTGFDEPAFGKYLDTPATGIAQRSYDAVGLYFELEYLGRNLWSEWWQIWTDASVGPWPTTNWFNHVTGAQYNALSQSWGSSFYKRPEYGKAWDVTAPQQTATSTLKPDTFSGGQKAVTAPPFSTSQMTVSPQPAGTAVPISASGPMRLIDGSNRELVNATLIVLCWDNCSCPSSSPLVSSLYQVQGPVNWAMTSLAAGGQAQFLSVPIGDVCKAKKNSYPPPLPNPCPVACPGSNGDPHLVTVNLRRLEFQAAGEFTLLRSSDGKFEVQVRQEPIASNFAGAAINTAVALRLGAHRMGAYLKGEALESHVDGKVVTSTADFGGDGRFVLYEKGFEAEAPDGSSVWALNIGKYGINLIVLPSAALTENGVGVLARIPIGAALPPLPDGTTLPFASPGADAYAFRYGRFANGWRVTDQTSLFDYDNGKSTASYTVAGFVPELGPAHPLVLDPVTRAAAESVCDPVGQVELHQQCVFDVAVTGQRGFVSGYTAAETFAAQGATPLYWGPKAGATAPTGSPLSGSTQLLPDIMGMSGSVLAPDGALYATVVQGTPAVHTTQVVAIDPSAAKVRTQATLDATAGVATGVAFASGSVWVVAASFTQTGRSCRVVRMDATSLQVQASIPLQTCPSGNPAIAANDGGVWVQQAVGGAKGPGELWRIDPSTNRVAGKVAVPNNPDNELTQAGMLLIGGALYASATAVFWSNGADLYRVRAPWSTVEDLHAARGGLSVAGDAALVETGPSRVNVYAGGPAQPPIAIGGMLAGAEGTQLYFRKPGTDGSELWRQPLSGGTPTLVAQVPAGTLAPWDASAGDARTPLWFAANAVLTVVPESARGEPLGLYLIVSPLR